MLFLLGDSIFQFKSDYENQQLTNPNGLMYGLFIQMFTDKIMEY